MHLSILLGRNSYALIIGLHLLTIFPFTLASPDQNESNKPPIFSIPPHLNLINDGLRVSTASPTLPKSYTTTTIYETLMTTPTQIRNTATTRATSVLDFDSTTKSWTTITFTAPSSTVVLCVGNLTRISVTRTKSVLSGPSTTDIPPLTKTGLETGRNLSVRLPFTGTTPSKVGDAGNCNESSIKDGPYLSSIASANQGNVSSTRIATAPLTTRTPQPTSVMRSLNAVSNITSSTSPIPPPPIISTSISTTLPPVPASTVFMFIPPVFNSLSRNLTTNFTIPPATSRCSSGPRPPFRVLLRHWPCYALLEVAITVLISVVVLVPTIWTLDKLGLVDMYKDVLLLIAMWLRGDYFHHR
ncbi:hypothetical protein EX30DRAFT_146261 [Ascodesmis nigricans]|uniref:Uncharacterized protein n=1 Tax=Ascodesmis nigricans TaxID=341454 RepID=A0A4S2N1J8_9PEZI|nr:hypothetical protein EX30DRAFT_146261 [Ascodesmis nigricans]